MYNTNMGGNNLSKNVFELTDCRGVRISCTEETWYYKILGSRPFMKDWLPLVKKTLENPHFICIDEDKKGREVYYLFHQYKANKYIKVIIKLGSNNKGYLISAFPTDNGKDGEKIIWTRSNN